MRIQSLLFPGLAALGLAATAVISGSTAQAYSGGKCLRFRDMTYLKQVDDRTLIAHTRSKATYKVLLRHACREFGWPGNFYTFRLHSDTECFDRDDVLVFRYGGSCFVESVTPAT